MLYRLYALVVKEVLSYVRDPRVRVILIGPPLMQLLVFSFAATLEVKNVDMALLDTDGSRASRELVESLAASGFIRAIHPVHDRQGLTAMIDRREVLLGMHLLPDFSQDLLSGRTGTIQLILDGRRANASQVAFNYISQVVQATDPGIAPGSVATLSAHSALTPVTRHWFNPNLTYQWFIVPGLSGILAMMIALVITALSIARERELGTFDQLLVSPLSATEIIIGKTIPAVLIGTLLSSLMIAAGVLIFRIPFTGSYALVFVTLLLFILSVVGIGLIVSSICQTQQQAILGAIMMAVPLVLISGFATPVENMPLWLQWVAEANPMKHYLVVVQGSFLKALPAEIVFDNIWPLLVIAPVTLVLATLFVRGRLE